MTPDELDRILSSEDVPEPSRDFTVTVMAAVHRQAEEPSPLPFPWVRFLAGLAGSGVIAAAGTVLLLWSEPAVTVPLARLATVMPELGYATAAVLVSLVLVTLPRLLVRP
jgi:hypothetical protein